MYQEGFFTGEHWQLLRTCEGFVGFGNGLGEVGGGCRVWVLVWVIDEGQLPVSLLHFLLGGAPLNLQQYF